MWGENDTTSSSKDGANGEAHGFELSSTLAAVSRGMEKNVNFPLKIYSFAHTIFVSLHFVLDFESKQFYTELLLWHLIGLAGSIL